jgi:hypothetical protein
MNNAEILAAVSRAVNDATFAKRSKAVQLGILTDAMNYIIDMTECLRQVDSSLTLVADQSSYALPATFIKFPTVDTAVKRGLVCLGTYGKYPLTVITQALLNNQYPGWRQTASGTPEWYALTETGTPQLILYPKPSTAFIASAGSTIFVDMVYRATDIVEDTNLPFDNGIRFKGLFQILLKLRAIWQIKAEDMQLPEEDRLGAEVTKLMESALDFVQSYNSVPGNHGFEEQIL